MWVILLAMGVFSSFISSITATVSLLSLWVGCGWQNTPTKPRLHKASESGFLKNHPSKSNHSCHFLDILSTYSDTKKIGHVKCAVLFCVCFSKTNGYTCVCFVTVSKCHGLQKKRRKTTDDQPESQQENTHGDHRGSLRASQAKQFQERASLLRFFCERNLSADLYGKAPRNGTKIQA